VIQLFFNKEGTVVVEFWVIKFTDIGLLRSAFIALRITLIVLGSSLLTLTTTPVELADGIESLLSPLRHIRVPVRDIAMIMSIALRFIPTLFEETNKIISAQKSRGASFDTGGPLARAKALLPVLIPLFVNSFRRADELAFAMDSRCYNATDKRVKMKVAKFGVGDAVALLVMCAFLTVIMLDRYYWCGLVDTLIFGGLL
jgi:energy-coupling factor transport system permease protein